MKKSNENMTSSEVKKQISDDEELLVDSKNHLELSDEDKIVDDLLHLGYFLIEKMNLKNISYLTYNDKEQDALARIIAVDNTGVFQPLEWDGIVQKSDIDYSEMIFEVEDLFDWDFRSYYKEQIEKISKQYYSNKTND